MSLSDGYFLPVCEVYDTDVGMNSVIPGLDGLRVSFTNPHTRALKKAHPLGSDEEPIPSESGLMYSMGGEIVAGSTVNRSNLVNHTNIEADTYTPYDCQIEATFLKVLSELYDEDIPLSLRLLEEILIYGIKSPRLITIYQIIFTSLSTSYTSFTTNDKHPLTLYFQLAIAKPAASNLQIFEQPKEIISTRENQGLGQHKRTPSCKRLSKRAKRLRNRELACFVCGKEFDRPSALASHSKTHSQLREFFCVHCSSTFKFKHDMERHLRRHTGEKPYPCSYCAQGFYRSDTLTTHKKSKHLNVNRYD